VEEPAGGLRVAAGRDEHVDGRPMLVDEPAVAGCVAGEPGRVDQRGAQLGGG
jgi:hypothetical protein